MRYAVSAIVLAVSLDAAAATAYWTGKQEFVFTVTGKSAIKCQYEYLGQFFWRLFVERSTCPTSIEVE